jgi:aldose 1-epimerase
VSPPPDSTPQVLPSGEQIELTLGDQRAVVVEVGAGLRTYALADRELLDGYSADAMCTSGRGQLLLPWPNRIRHGRYEWDGRTHQLALTEPSHANAIHGLVRWVPWTVAERGPGRVLLEHVLYPQPGYPFALALAVEYVLSESGLSVRTTATNVGSEACPYGAGAHPYLTVGTPTVDPAILRAPGSTMLTSDDDGIPIGAETGAGTPYDFRQPRPIGATRLDNAFTDLERGDDGLARVEFEHPDDGMKVTLWVDDAYPYLMLFTGDPLPDVNRRSLAVEPMTCPPNAFAGGDGIVRLEPGQSHSGTWGIAPRA